MSLLSALVLLLQLVAVFGQTFSSSSFSSASPSSSSVSTASTVFSSSSSSAALASSSSSLSSSSVSASASSSAVSASSSVSSSPYSASSSSSFYSGNEPSFPGCYLCPAITQCPTFPNTSIYPAFSIFATTSLAADAASCNAITLDILVEVTQYAPTNSCIEQIGALACYGSLTQQLNCHQPVAPEWPALCENYTSCLELAGQAFIAQAGLCTNITGFLNRPTTIQAGSSGSLSSSSSTGAVATAVSSVSTVVAATSTSAGSTGSSGGGATVSNGAPSTHVSVFVIALALALCGGLLA